MARRQRKKVTRQPDRGMDAILVLGVVVIVVVFFYILSQGSSPPPAP